MSAATLISLPRVNVHRYEPPDGDNGLRGDPALVAAIETHIAEHYGSESSVWRSPESEERDSPIHLRIVRPGPDRPALTAVTVGMSERPMVAGDVELSCELVMVMPPSWPLDDPAHWWPLLALDQLAHFPHDYKAFLRVGDTIENPYPWSPSGLSGAMLGDQVLVPSEAAETLTFAGREIHFVGAWLLYQDELDFKVKHGTERLWDLLVDAGVSEAVEPDRPSVVPRRRGLFRNRG